MWTLGVVESEVIGQSLLSSLERGIGFEIDIFILDRTPQPFGKDIVHASASAIVGFGNIAVASEINILILHGAPQALGENIIQASAAAIHIDLNVVGRKKSGVTG